MAKRSSAHPAGHGTRSVASAARRLMAMVAVILSAAAAVGPASSAFAEERPRLASLQIEIWPEFDRPAAALVILRGEVAPDVTLPAAVSLRIPATSGGPTAVAYSASPASNVLNLKYERTNAADSIALRFEVPERFFHVEFYDPLPTTGPGRSYTYVWSADLGADRLGVIVQEPAAANDLAVQPALATVALGQDGLAYRSAELGRSPAGKPVRVKLAYTKSDPRTSTDILRANAAELPIPVPTGVPTKKELLLWLTGVVALMVAGSVAVVAWWNRRRGLAEMERSPIRSCRKCRAAAAPDDRFCSRCGSPLP